MDSKLVSAELRVQVRPVLKAAGFSRFTDRTAWRYADDRVDVVNFQSFTPTSLKESAPRPTPSQ